MMQLPLFVRRDSRVRNTLRQPDFLSFSACSKKKRARSAVPPVLVFALPSADEIPLQLSWRSDGAGQ